MIMEEDQPERKIMHLKSEESLRKTFRNGRCQSLVFLSHDKFKLQRVILQVERMLFGHGQNFQPN